MHKKYIFLILLFLPILMLAQEKRKVEFKVKLDSRSTFVDRESVGIWGIRGGFLINKKYEFGLGVYSSNLLGLLGKNVEKDYVDNSFSPSKTIPAKVGFHYASVYGEYVILENKRWKFIANTQVGLGNVSIEFNEAVDGKEDVTEGKGLVEHSLKVELQTFSWLRLSAGGGYRYLFAGEQQIKDAFNAPIYIVGFSINFKKLFGKDNKLEK